MASWILILAAAIVGGEQGAGGPGAVESGSVGGNRQASAPAERGFHEFQQQISELLKRESQAKDTAARAAAVRAMCELHGEIVHDPRYAASDVLKEYRGRKIVLSGASPDQVARMDADHRAHLDTVACRPCRNAGVFADTPASRVTSILRFRAV
jgi:hypothetical protein